MANSTERIGIYHCAEIAERNKWMFREQPIDDVGIDAHMEFIDNMNPKQLIALQIKSGSSWFKEKRGNSIIFRGINERQYNYGTMNTLPCIVVLYMLSIFGCVTLFNFIISKWTNFYPDGFWKFFSTMAIIYAIILCIILVLNVCGIVTCYIMLLIKKRRLKK